MNFKNTAALLLFFLIPLFSFSQECNCESNFNWVKKTFEDNDAGFAYAIEQKGASEYQKLNVATLPKVKAAKTVTECSDVIDTWLHFFRKGHVSIRPTEESIKPLESELDITAKFKDWETYKFKQTDFEKYLSKITTPTLEGVWFTAPYTIGIVKQKGGYIGFVMEDTNAYWKKGMVKLHINEVKGKLSGEFYMRDHNAAPFDEATIIENNYLRVGSFLLKRLKPDFKSGDKSFEQNFKLLSSEKPFIEELDDRTVILRIPTFNASHRKAIDSIITANMALLTRTQNLIIDIRNNGGGSDSSYNKILPLMYTNPIRSVGVELYSTPLNNARMNKLIEDPNYDEGTKKWAREGLVTLNNNLGKFINLDGDKVSTTKLDTIYEYPKNIAILINQDNGSTAEEFLLAAKQSKKVKLFGTTTFGCLDISNMNFAISPCNELRLGYCLSRSFRIPDMAIDGKGLQPDYFIDSTIPDYKWVDYTVEVLNNK